MMLVWRHQRLSWHVASRRGREVIAPQASITIDFQLFKLPPCMGEPVWEAVSAWPKLRVI